MEISAPSLEDVSAIVQFVKEARSRSALSDFEVDCSVLERTVRTCIIAPHIYIRVLKSNNDVCGLICGVITPATDMFGDVATDIMFYIRPEFRGRRLLMRKLLNGFLEWSFGFNSVLYVALNISIGGEEADRTDRLYSLLGFQKAGSSFVVRRSK